MKSQQTGGLGGEASSASRMESQHTGGSGGKEISARGMESQQTRGLRGETSSVSGIESQKIGRLGGEARSANRLARCNNCNKNKDKVLLKDRETLEKEIIYDHTERF